MHADKEVKPEKPFIKAVREMAQIAKENPDGFKHMYIEREARKLVEYIKHDITEAVFASPGESMNTLLGDCISQEIINLTQKMLEEEGFEVSYQKRHCPYTHNYFYISWRNDRKQE